MHYGNYFDKLPLRKVDFDKGPDEPGVPATIKDANIVCSRHPETKKDKHIVMLDLDYECHLFTSTHGLGHLIIHKELSTADLDKLLSVMVEVGLYQKGNLQRLRQSGFVGLRLPWIIKEGRSSENFETPL